MIFAQRPVLSLLSYFNVLSNLSAQVWAEIFQDKVFPVSIFVHLAFLTMHEFILLRKKTEILPRNQDNEEL